MNSQGTLTTVSQQTPWQGYPGQHAMPLPPHLAQGQGQGQGQYPWQQQWNPQYGYPPMAPHASQPTYMSNPPMPGAMMGGKKSKKDKHGVPMMGDYGGLGKRPADGGHEEDADGKKKKGKKEEEKPVPKPIAKSHLHPPRQAQSAWQLFFTDELNKAKATAALETSPGGTPQHVKLNVAQIAKDAGAAYASLDDEQREYYSQKVQESKEQYAKDLAVWQATLTPEDIRAENAFRAQQRKEGKSRKGNLKDPNAPKKPLSAYFLFLKGIREDDGLRSKVWGEETETTKQSVLAAERWRALSVEEKKVSHELRSWLILQPYLQQAEQDKQEYESARKMYEEDAAARARGEDVPPRPVHVPDVPIVKLELSKPRVKDVLREKPSKVAAKIEEPDFGEFTHETTEHDETDHSMEIADYQGFQDPLEDTDLSGFHGVTAPGAGEHGEQWDLQNLMGDAPEFRKPALDAISPAVSPEAAISAEAAVEGAATPAKDTEATSIAPTMAEAVAETTEDIPAVPAPPTANEEDVREVAAAAEGSLPVPQGLFEPSIDPETSGVPTEEVNELLLAGMPRAIDDLPMGTAVQVEAEAEAQVEAGFVVEPEKDEPMSEDVPGEPHSAETVAPPPETAGEVESLAAHPAESFDIAALTGEIAPEALELEEPDQIRAASVSTAIEAEELDQRGGEITSEAVEAGKRDQYGGIASQAIEGGKSDQQQGEIAPLVIDPHGPDLPSGPASPPAKEEVTAAPATATGLDDTPLENRDAPAADGV